MEFIGKGTFREAYKVQETVIKKNNHFIGEMQSYMELDTYNGVPEKFKKHFNPVYLVNDDIQVCKYCEPYGDPDLNIWDHERRFFTMNIYDDAEETPMPYIKDFEELEIWLYNRGIAIDELVKADNFGVTQDNDICFIDYGMTCAMLDTWEREIDAGNLPFTVEDHCSECGVCKKVTIYSNEPIICNECKEESI